MVKERIKHFYTLKIELIQLQEYQDSSIDDLIWLGKSQPTRNKLIT